MKRAYFKHSIEASPLAVRFTPPSPGGRRQTKPSTCSKSISDFMAVKDYPAQAPAFLLDSPIIRRERVN